MSTLKYEFKTITYIFHSSFKYSQYAKKHYLNVMKGSVQNLILINDMLSANSQLTTWAITQQRVYWATKSNAQILIYIYVQLYLLGNQSIFEPMKFTCPSVHL